MKSSRSLLVASLISAGAMIVLSATLRDWNVAFAIGIAIFIALGGFSASQRGE